MYPNVTKFVFANELELDILFSNLKFPHAENVTDRIMKLKQVSCCLPIFEVQNSRGKGLYE